MIADKLVDHISTVPFLSEIKGSESIGGVAFHEEDFAADHGDELRSNDIETTLKDLI
jgi:hypothetical protein